MTQFPWSKIKSRLFKPFILRVKFWEDDDQDSHFPYGPVPDTWPNKNTHVVVHWDYFIVELNSSFRGTLEDEISLSKGFVIVEPGFSGDVGHMNRPRKVDYIFQGPLCSPARARHFWDLCEVANLIAWPVFQSVDPTLSLPYNGKGD